MIWAQQISSSNQKVMLLHMPIQVQDDLRINIILRMPISITLNV